MNRALVVAFLVFVGFSLICQGKPVKPKQGKCGYASCDLGKPDMVNVHLVSHSHDDVGWLKTVDQYFYGYKNNIQHAGVQYIIDTVVQQLKVGDQKRFIYVEIAYFYRWWNEQSNATKELTKQLVDNGNLQFILGGWCMNDEASTHYTAIIDQHTLGLKFLKDNFGECGRPLVAWQIDPFGHSMEQANLFAQMGYDGLYFWRLDYQDKANRRSKKTMELIWNGNSFLPGTDLFTGALNGSYCPPPGFCFDELCGDDPIMDDKRMHDSNVPKRIDDFLEVVKYQAKYFTTNHIMIPMGCDFQYQNARTWYANLDKLIKYTNARQANGSKYNIMYSTPSCYTYAVNQANQKYSTVVGDDFFPYADSPNSFWTGYFTSRAALKYMVRRTNAFLQAVKQLSVFSRLPVASIQPKIDPLRRAMGVLQHHDAVSGTEKQAVAYDYAQRLSEGIAPALEAMDQSLAILLNVNNDFVVCPLVNTSSCNFTRTQTKFSIVVYNPASQPRNHIIRFPVSDNYMNYVVRDFQGKTIQAAALKVSTRTMAIPEGKTVRGNYDLMFAASLPALGYSVFTVQLSPPPSFPMIAPPRLRNLKQPGVTEFSNGLVTLTFDTLTGMLISMKNIQSNLTLPLQTSLKFYTGWQGNGRPSGAYVFRPNEETANGWSTATITYQDNGLVKEIYQEFTSWASLVYRLYANVAYVEVEWTVGSLPLNDKIGREVILNYITPFTTTKFFTDANGRQLLERQINYRKTWNFSNTEPVSGNYYPINSRIAMRDELNGGKGSQTVEFVVLTDRSEGGGSHRMGELEVMLHRNTIKDDSLGVGEPLNETGIDGNGLIVRGRHMFYFDTLEKTTEFHRQNGALEFMQPAVLFSKNVPASLNNSPWSALTRGLPPNVQLLTLENWDGNSKLLRLEHIYAYDDKAGALSGPAIVELSNLFVDFYITNAELMNLAANQKMTEMNRLKWMRSDGKINVSGGGATLSGTLVTLQPMAIATMVVS